jgi:SP family sugar:H+ symporter-like MFS transporter
VGLSAVWGIILGITILFLPESPRFAYRQGRHDEARRTMARIEGLDDINHPLIEDEIKDIREQMEKENTGADHHWYEIFTGSAMLHRTLLGMVLQAGQQLTGANFFFYYGTTIFKATGISNSFITSIILGAVNLGATVASLWIIKRVGRRPLLMIGAAWMCVCFLIYSFVGHFEIPTANPESAPTAGAVLIVFTCLFIVAFAITWGPLVWSVISELYPPQYRGYCMALATASNWLFNFLISFFTTFITNKIDYFYGLVFAGCCFALFFVVYFFMMESKDRSLEEIDQMYTQGVDPRKSAAWKNPLKQAQPGVSTGSELPTEVKGEMRNRSPVSEVASALTPDRTELDGDIGQAAEDIEMQIPARSPSRLVKKDTTPKPNSDFGTAPLQ